MTRVLPLLLLFAALTAYALPTLTGPSGLVALPDALPSASRLTLAADVAENPGDRGISLRAVLGMSGGEVGALYSIDDENMLGLNGKLSRALSGGTALGLGAIYLDTKSVTERCVYLAATSPGPLALTGGVTWTEVRTAAGSADAVRPYAGLSLALPGVMRLRAEYQVKSDTLFEPHPLYSIMLVRPEELTTTTIGITNAIGLLGGAETYFVAGYSLAL